LENLGVGVNIILKCVFEKWGGGHGLDLLASEERQVWSSCEFGNEPSGLIKCGEFFY
jgi:hypothetical protein